MSTHFKLLDSYYRLFSFGNGRPDFNDQDKDMKFLTLTGDIIRHWRHTDVLNCFIALGLFGLLEWKDDCTVCMYFNKNELNRAKYWIEKNWVKQNPQVLKMLEDTC